ncbi:MAG: Rrf2 family transcriptional regulator [Actinomycetota bacterium]|jgi:Rrf2 family protein|nr:Rrf2 family transcriptional regulator [Actinomycetota bacterium]
MNMTLSKRGDYVVRSALALARAYPSGEARKIREIVAEMGVPQTFASQILADLVRAGLATSKAGKDGGYRLARPPEEISTLDVVEAGEGPLRAERCALGEGPCRWDTVCPLHETWRSATTALRDVLAATSLAELARQDVAIEQGTLTAPSDSHRHGGTSIAVDDFVQVEASAAAVAAHLRHGPAVSAAVAAAYQQAEVLRAELAEGGPGWAPVDVAVSCFVDRSAAAPGCEAGEDPCGAVELSFEARGPGDTDSHGELMVQVTDVDPLRSELRATGQVRLPPLPPSGTDRSLEHRLAQLLVRTMLRRLAHDFEDPLPSGDLAPSRRRTAAR